MKKFVITVIMCLAMIFADFSSLLVLAEYTEPSEKDPAATETNENNNTETTNNAVESEADIESTIETTAEPTSVPDESETVEKEMQEKANAEENLLKQSLPMKKPGKTTQLKPLFLKQRRPLNLRNQKKMIRCFTG